MMNIILQTQVLRITANGHTGLETLQVAKCVSMYTITQSSLSENQANTPRNLNKVQNVWDGG